MTRSERRRPGATVDTREVRLLEGPNLYFPRPAVKVTLALTGYLAAPGDDVRAVCRGPRPARGQPGAPGSEQRQQALVRVVERGDPRARDRGGAPAARGPHPGRHPRTTSSSARSSGGTAVAPRRWARRSDPCSSTCSPGRPFEDAVRERAAAVAAAPLGDGPRLITPADPRRVGHRHQRQDDDDPPRSPTSA